MTALRIFAIAGEASGDILGGRLLQALHRLSPRPVEVAGVGGPLMADAGLESLVPQSDLAVMGLFEILPRLLLLKNHINKVADFATRYNPDVVLTIDSPGFCFRVVDKLPAVSAPKVHYVAPSVWAWRPKRAVHLGRRYDHLLTLFDFEPELFTPHGLDATFVGHSAVESGYAEAEAAPLKQAFGIPASAPVLGVLPGSRRGEINNHGPIFSEVVRRLAVKFPDMVVLVPTLPSLADHVREHFKDLPVPVHVSPDLAQKPAMFKAMTAALAASGTVTLELALAGAPTIVAYRANPLTIAIVKQMIKIPHVGLINILAGEEVVPEYLQERCRPDLLTGAMQSLLEDKTARAKQLRHIEPQIARLWPAGVGGIPPSTRAAEVILQLADKGR